MGVVEMGAQSASPTKPPAAFVNATFSLDCDLAICLSTGRVPLARRVAQRG
jgi:hypothetical protein